jgi:hypothetical protein
MATTADHILHHPALEAQVRGLARGAGQAPGLQSWPTARGLGAQVWSSCSNMGFPTVSLLWALEFMVNRAFAGGGTLIVVGNLLVCHP